jgi:hypothetical protein
MLTIQHYKESLSRAYITAIVGSARQQLKWGAEYDYGVDGQVKRIINRNGRHTEAGFGFDFQAKASTDWELRDDHIIYDLEVDSWRPQQWCNFPGTPTPATPGWAAHLRRLA